MVKFGEQPEPFSDFIQVCGFIDYELEDAGIVVDQAADDVGAAAGCFVSFGPRGSVGSGVGKFGADGDEVSLNFEEYGTGGFYGDAAAEQAGLSGEFGEIWQ